MSAPIPDFDRDLIRGRHYGQRSREPRKQAEHMAATDQLHREGNPCQQGAVLKSRRLAYPSVQPRMAPLRRLVGAARE